MRHLAAVNTHQEAVSVCDKALRNNFLPSVAVRLVAGSIHLTVGCPTSSAQWPEPKCYKPPKTCKQCLRQTNQNRILKTLLPKPCCKKQGAASCLTTKTCYFSKTPEWGQKIGTKTGRARSLPSSQECEAGCSNQRDGQAKGRHAQPTMPMKPQRLAGRERFWKARRHRKHHPRWTPFLGPNGAPLKKRL